MCIFVVLLINKYLSSNEMELILINIKRNYNYYYTIKTSFIPIYDTHLCVNLNLLTLLMTYLIGCLSL